MENASKALIIAGAILISILLISVGVLIMNSTGNIQDTSTKNTEQIAIRTFNSNFTPYEEENQPASQIKQLISTVKSNNAGIKTGEEKYVKLTFEDNLSATTIKSSQRYKVELGYDDNTGYVNEVKIKLQK